MSDANRTAVAIVKETTPGTTPATPAFRKLRVTGSNLTYGTRTVVSSELRADRQITDLTRVGYEAGGQVQFEVSHAALDDIMEGAMFNDWTARYPVHTNQGVDQITSVDGATDTVVYSGGSAYAADDIVRCSGFRNAENNGVFVAQALTDADSLVLPAGRVDEASPPSTARIKKVGVQAAAGVIAATATGLTGVPVALGLAAGDWFKIGGAAAATQFATTANNGFVRVGSVSGTTVELDVRPTGWAADAGAAKTIQLFVGERIRNGTTDKSYTVEQQMQDLTVPEYHLYAGMKVGTLQLSSTAQQLLTGSVTFRGMSASIATARTQGATDIEAPAFEVMSASSNVGAIYENGVRVQGPNFVMGAEINVENSLRSRNALGSEGAVSIGVGRVNVTGRLNTYYGDKTLIEKLRNNQATSYTAVFGNGDNTAGKECLLVDLPRIKFSGGDPTVQGVDTDRMVDLGFQATMHPSLGYTVQFQKFEGYTG